MSDELRTSHAWLKHLATASDVGALVIAPDGELDLATEGALRHFGITDEQALTRIWRRTYLPQIDLPCPRSSGGDHELWTRTLTLESPGGDHERLQLRIYEVRANDCAGFLGLVATEHARVAESNVRALAEAHRNIQFVLHSAVHEIRSPLNAIGLIAQDLVDRARLGGSDSSGVQLNGLQAIHAELQRLARLVETLLVEAAPIDGSSERFEITATLPECATLLGATAEASNIELEVSVDADPAWVEGSRDQFKQALINCVVNAIQAVEAEPTEGHRVALRCTPAGPDELAIDIEDSGPGFRQEQASHAFDPYFTTRADGTGLGLHLAREYVRSLGGTIEIGRSSLGGAAVRIRMPICAAEPMNGHPPARPRAAER